ncbi:MAG TPA: efflux transporter outer membrane subunit [Thermomonas sp.]|nr:efflux transporter outer membrane subunit [Thermomonas sp.]
MPGTLALLTFVFAGTGCVLGPDYVRPTVEVPDSYRFGSVAAAPGSVAVATLAEMPAWWRGFGDPELDALVQEALVANHDLHIATARVDEFAAYVTAASAPGLPQVGYGAGAGRQRAAGRTDGNYSALLSASWEIDLWGRIRRETEAARGNLLATEQARLGVALTLVSSVVSGYVTLLDFDRRLEIAKATVDGRKGSVDLFQLRLDGGAVSDFEMMQVTAEYELAVSAVPVLEQSIAQQEHALSALVGRTPGPITRGGKLEDLAAPAVPAGLPSELIARRPDILQSEQQLVAANALVGAARTLYFPSLALTGFGGSASSNLDALFSGPARTWSFAGQLLGPIFAGGAIDAANQQALARREQALAGYRKAIQNAFRDVDDSLASIKSTDDLVASLERRVAALRRAVDLARVRYDNGYSDYLEVLDTERSLFSAELSLTSARGDRYRALVDLYRALGGDWIGQIAPLAAPGSPGNGEDTTRPGGSRTSPY